MPSPKYIVGALKLNVDRLKVTVSGTLPEVTDALIAAEEGAPTVGVSDDEGAVVTVFVGVPTQYEIVGQPLASGALTIVCPGAQVICVTSGHTRRWQV